MDLKPLIICGLKNLDPCRFAHLVQVTQNLIFNLILLSSVFATAAFAYAGFKLLTSGGDEKAKTEAKEIFKKVVWGFVWILVAWLLVYTITEGLLNEGYSILGSPQ